MHNEPKLIPFLLTLLRAASNFLFILSLIFIPLQTNSISVCNFSSFKFCVSIDIPFEQNTFWLLRLKNSHSNNFFLLILFAVHNGSRAEAKAIIENSSTSKKLIFVILF